MRTWTRAFLFRRTGHELFARRGLRRYSAWAKTHTVFAAIVAAIVLILLAPLDWRPAGPVDWSGPFRDPPPDYSMGVYWWWFGPAVTKDEAVRELDVMRRAKISYVLIFPIYPLSVDDPARGIKNLQYLSPEFLDVLAHTASKAKQMGITVDLLMGTGWPYGGPWITPELAAKKLRHEVQPASPGVALRLPALKEHEKLIAAWLVKGDGNRVHLAGAIDVTEKIAGGSFTPSADEADGRVLMTFLQAPTGMQVKRPSLGAEGLVMDHLSREALNTYLKEVGAKLLSAVPKGTLRALHSDSKEVYGTEWTPTLPDEFRRRRSYDLIPYLPALVANAGPLSADVRHDYWKTLSEMALDNYVRPLREWCHRHDVGLQAESYGTPPVDMRSFSEVDYPMGESYDWKMFVASRWASSAAHQYGKRVTSAEAYTWLRFPRYVSTVQDIKLGSDLHFICGINKIVAHGYAYSPPAAGLPGWGYYASIMMNDNNTWWPYFHLLSDYVRRVSYALSLGKPQVDAAIYLPEDDVFAAHVPGQGRGLNLYMTTKFHLAGGKRVPEFGLPAAYESETPLIKTLITGGYSFDGFDHSLLQPGLKTSAGRLEVGDVAYRIAILPNITGVSLPILETLADFVRNGGVLIATRRLPDRAWGVANREANYARVKRIVREIFGEGSETQTRRHRCGKGSGIFVPDDTKHLADVLASLGPEVVFESPDADLVFLHRGEGSRHLYFLANTSRENKSFKAAFRDGKGRPRLWDAMTGDIREAPAGTEMPIELEPFGSIIVEFDGTRSAAVGEQPLERIAGSPLSVSGPFTLRIGEREIRVNEAGFWTEYPEFRFYSGRGDYRTEVDLPQNLFGPGRGLWLDLGDVREIADVTVNGRHAGVRWKLPYRLDITGFAQPGKNVLTVGVTNLLINRILGEPLPDYSALEPLRFPKPQEKERVLEPLPSGILGPVRVIPYTLIDR